MTNALFLESILSSLDVFIFAKDLHGRFTYANEKLASVSGLDSSAQLIGKTDNDAVWKAQAGYFQELDRKVLTHGPYLQLPEVILGPNSVTEIVVSKNILTDNCGKACGVIGSFIPCNGKMLVEKLGELDSSSNGGIRLGQAFGDAVLTRKEIEVYYYTLLGHSAARIASTVHRSKRTIEHHVIQLKNKMQCRTHGDLIATATTTGLTYTIFNAMELMQQEKRIDCSGGDTEKILNKG